jgi:phage terminase small subunit
MTSTAKKLTKKQQAYCNLYLESGNGVEAVMQAGYKVNGNRKLAAVISSENLTKPNICEYLRAQLKKSGLTEESVRLQHLFLINQFADLSVKQRAIDMYYKVTGKYNTKEDPEHPKITEIILTHYGDPKTVDTRSSAAIQA